MTNNHKLNKERVVDMKHEKLKAMWAIRDYLEMNLRIVNEEIEEIINDK